MTALRFCPSCGKHCAELFCPNDRVATFSVARTEGDASRLATGDLVAGKYRITKQLGRGGFGAVYEADHAGGLGKVALKVLAIADQDEGDIRRFYREAQVTAALRHANTVRVFDVGQAETGALFLAMELLQGKSLEEELKERARRGEVLSESQTIDVACDVLKSLSEAHSQGLVHRDLKPANLMLTDVDGERVVKVLDFGIALVQDSSLTGTGHALGTPAYMSPEQCAGATLDGRSDLYSLGVMLFRCVAGRPPFSDPNPLTLMYAHSSQMPPDLFTMAKVPISEAFAQCVMRALAKEPKDRFANARDMRQALESARAAEPADPRAAFAGETHDYPVGRAAGNMQAADPGRPLTPKTPGRTEGPRYVVTTATSPLEPSFVLDTTLQANMPASRPTPATSSGLPTAVVTPGTPVPVRDTPTSSASRKPWFGLAVAGIAVGIAGTLAVLKPRDPGPAPAAATAPAQAAPTTAVPMAMAVVAAAQPPPVATPVVAAAPAPVAAVAPAPAAALPAPPTPVDAPTTPNLAAKKPVATRPPGHASRKAQAGPAQASPGLKGALPDD